MPKDTYETEQSAADIRRATRKANRELQKMIDESFFAKVIASGVRTGLDRFYVGLITLLLLIVAFTWVHNTFWPTPRDSTDPATGPRSGLSVMVDAQTGCEYLSTVTGGLTPRLGTDGKQAGCQHG